jgi:hypothetical protein
MRGGGVTMGASMAFESPWGTWKKAPIGRDIPWMRVTDALENAMPAYKDILKCYN